MTPRLFLLEPDVAYEPIRDMTASVRAACPRCPWRGDIPRTASTWGWRQRIARDVRMHTCANPDQEPQ